MQLECTIWWRSCPQGLYGDFNRAEGIESVQLSPLRDIRAILYHLLATANIQGATCIEAFPSPCLLVCKLQAFIGGKDVLVSLPTGYGKSPCFALLPCHAILELRGSATSGY